MLIASFTSLALGQLGFSFNAEFRIGTAAEDLVRGYCWITDRDRVLDSFSVFPARSGPVCKQVSDYYSIHTLSKSFFLEEDFSLGGVAPVPVW